MIRVLTHVATYLALGPPVGAFGAFLAIGLYQTTKGQVFDLPGTAASFVDGKALGLVYAIGIVPALVISLLSLTWVRDVRGPRCWLIAAIVGCIASGALGCLTLPLALIFPPVILIIPGLAIAGLVGGGICSAAAEGLAGLYVHRTIGPATPLTGSKV